MQYLRVRTIQLCLGSLLAIAGCSDVPLADIPVTDASTADSQPSSTDAGATPNQSDAGEAMVDSGSNGTSNNTPDMGTTNDSAPAATGEPGVLSPCDSNGWCWEEPSPQGALLEDTWGSGPTDRYAVGPRGNALHFDGNKWSRLRLPREFDYAAVHGTDANTVFIAGSAPVLDKGTVLRFDGSLWYTYDFPKTALRDIWVVSATEAYAVGFRRTVIGSNTGVIYQFDGTDWVEVVNTANPSELFESIAGTTNNGPNTRRALAVGKNGTAYELLGQTWSPLAHSFNGTPDFTAVAVSQDVAYLGTSGGELFRIAGVATVQQHTSPTTAAINNYSLVGTNEVYAVTDAGQILKQDASSVNVISSPGHPLKGVFAAATDEIYAVGSRGHLYSLIGGVLSNGRDGTESQLLSVHGNTASNGYAVGVDGTILHYDGNTWTDLNNCAQTNTCDDNLIDVWVSSTGEVFAVGDSGTILRFDGTAWQVMNSSTFETLVSVWGSSATDVWAVGLGGALVHYDGTAWSPVTHLAGAANLTGVWGRSANEVYVTVAGANGSVMRWDGTGWSFVATSNEPLLAVWVDQATGIAVATGFQETILYFDGTTWTQVTAPGLPLGLVTDLAEIHGVSANEIYVVAQLGLVYRFDGSQWSVEGIPVGQTLHGVWATSDGPVVVGDHGVILRQP